MVTWQQYEAIPYEAIPYMQNVFDNAVCLKHKLFSNSFCDVPTPFLTPHEIAANL